MTGATAPSASCWPHASRPCPDWLSTGPVLAAGCRRGPDWRASRGGQGGQFNEQRPYWLRAMCPGRESRLKQEEGPAGICNRPAQRPLATAPMMPRTIAAMMRIGNLLAGRSPRASCCSPFAPPWQARTVVHEHRCLVLGGQDGGPDAPARTGGPSVLPTRATATGRASVPRAGGWDPHREAPGRPWSGPVSMPWTRELLCPPQASPAWPALPDAPHQTVWNVLPRAPDQARCQ